MAEAAREGTHHAEGTPVAPTGKSASIRWEYNTVEVSTAESTECAITYQAQNEDEEAPGITGVTTMGDLLGTYGKLGWELGGHREG